MEDSERDKNDVLYDDKYLSEALEKVRNIINEVLDENEKLKSSDCRTTTKSKLIQIRRGIVILDNVLEMLNAKNQRVNKF